MAEFVEVQKANKRMCGNCNNCPLDYDNNGYDMNCVDLLQEHPEEYERIVMQWAKEHPIKTNADKFKEVFGLELRDGTGHGCANIECPSREVSCSDCEYDGFWEREYVEPKKEEN